MKEESPKPASQMGWLNTLAVAENRLLSRSSLWVSLEDSHEGKFISAGRALIKSCGFHFVCKKYSLSVDMHGLLGNGERLGWLLRSPEEILLENWK